MRARIFHRFWFERIGKAKSIGIFANVIYIAKPPGC